THSTISRIFSLQLYAPHPVLHPFPTRRSSDLSVVEQTLRSEPADVYGDMDFATRDRYRHVVEILSRHSALSEIEMARKAVELAQESAQQKGREDRTAHVGFYLIDKGLPRLERASGARGR